MVRQPMEPHQVPRSSDHFSPEGISRDKLAEEFKSLLRSGPGTETNSAIYQTTCQPLLAKPVEKRPKRSVTGRLLFQTCGGSEMNFRNGLNSTERAILMEDLRRR
ncbi:hypothetical protein N7448_007534 [Penicillium atrosanguineum]|uniref:Uncharacterized protein n=1 Tax=Penicillium atrosanguineum TaxID=1132637 RepID=A0A9W9UEW8_9EURO|nr:hypothetical protein N7448_007534 [Penicillium atrosanguineum]KAJ5146959.1 hypothetical protein N7526_000311 [Penicillium atrosanguineum]KAJ5331730.1 hypothetical protein N7476_001513 [Penicillium atrosanguineum]